MQKLPWWVNALIGFGAGIVLGVVVMIVVQPLEDKSVGSFSTLVNPLPSKKQPTNWLAQVGPYWISATDVDKGLELFLAQLSPQQRAQLQNNPDIKSQLLEEFINQYVVLLEAMKDKNFQTPENQYLIQASVRQAVYQLYIRNHLPKDTMVFLPTEAEINAFYEQNKAQLSKLNLPAAQLKLYIQQEIGNRKLQQWAESYVRQLRESYPIKRNQALLGQSAPLAPLPLQQK